MTTLSPRMERFIKEVFPEPLELEEGQLSNSELLDGFGIWLFIWFLLSAQSEGLQLSPSLVRLNLSMTCRTLETFSKDIQVLMRKSAEGKTKEYFSMFFGIEITN